MPRRNAPIPWWISGRAGRVAERPPLALAVYRQLTSAATPLIPLWLRYRLKQQKEHPQRLGERYGAPTRERPPGPLVWVHGASVGEMLSVIPLIQRLRAEHLNVLMTSGTLTSAWLAGQRLPDGVIHQFVPLDIPKFVSRFLHHWRPDLALFVESDLWPNIITETADRGIPLGILNGRMSAKSFAHWRKYPRFAAALLQRVDLCLTQSDADAGRYQQLGAARVIMTGNLKLDVPPPAADAERLGKLQAATAGRSIVVAASTHPGEDEVLIEVHRQIKQAHPDLLTIVAPRHPERGESIAELVQAAGLRATRRSTGELPTPETDIYVADTLGELGILYRAAAIVFMGGSLVRHGGQNPIEPAKLGAPILHGVHVWNFADVYVTLDKTGGARQINNAADLVMQAQDWLEDPEARQAAAEAASMAVSVLTGALERTLIALEPYLLKLRLERPSSHA
jgi:3-deoxy-D-manno-octulosonic-acid transferase